ncbi:hypothetical protein CP532_4111 [Ophiocordyceps camponoti-leonardi (nom. inval.)]|nr:hypothetical protein CP532_4111 [Ophiocordyceps camponoti-leonardi (nom. inval.)]
MHHHRLALLSWLLYSHLSNAIPGPNTPRPNLYPRSPDHVSDSEEDRPGVDKGFFLFRGELGSARRPSRIRQLGGFEPENPGYEEYESCFSIRHHIRGRPAGEVDSDSDSEASNLVASDPSTEESPWHTAFVSLSFRPDTAAYYAAHETEPGYIYIVAPSPNIIDPSSITALESMASANEEVVALGGIQFSQVYGWITYPEFNEIEQDLRRDIRFAPVDDDVDFVRELVNRVLQQATANPSCDMRWSSRHITTGRTSDFQGRVEATRFMDSLTGIAGWQRRFPLQLGLDSHGSGSFDEDETMPQPGTSRGGTGSRDETMNRGSGLYRLQCWCEDPTSG